MARQPAGRLAKVSGSHARIDPQPHYDGWAKTYNDDLLNEYGYCAHRIGVAAFAAELADRTAQVIDVGCGTGLVGAELAAADFTAIDGVDISQGMLDEAAKTGAYRRLIRQDAGQGPAIAASSYDGVICIGSFGGGHLGPGAMAGLVRMARPGAPVVIFMNAVPYAEEGFEAHIRAMERDGLWAVLRIEDHNYMDALERPGKLIVARPTATADC